MRRILALFVLILVTAGGASAALINVTQANYIVVNVNINKHSFGVDLVQNGARNTRTRFASTKTLTAIGSTRDGPTLPCRAIRN